MMKKETERGIIWDQEELRLSYSTLPSPISGLLHAAALVPIPSMLAAPGFWLLLRGLLREVGGGRGG
jgi:hypothetical protein